MSWFAVPTYPDGDPLLTVIEVYGPPATEPSVIPLEYIDPARVCFFVDRGSGRMYMMRIEGTDVSPDI